MKKFILFLLLASPLLAWAQADDVYYVPKKENKQQAVKTASDFYLAEDDVWVEDEDDLYESDEYVDEVETAYFTNDLYEVMDDYTYSSRIVRFQSPRRMLSNSLYWDLKYNCGINDWLVYDDGYAVYVYPTANNIYYNYPYCYNRWGWDAYRFWNYPYYGYHNHWHHYDYAWHTPHWHNPHWHNHHTANISWRPSKRMDNMPTNGSIASNRGARREQQPRTSIAGSNPRREQMPRIAAGSSNPRREQQVRTTVTGNSQRRQQQSTTTKKSDKTTRPSSTNGSVRRAGSTTSSNSSSGYSRPSSTSVSRSNGSSGSTNRNGGGSSRSSGGSRSNGGGGARSGGARR